ENDGVQFNYGGVPPPAGRHPLRRPIGCGASPASHYSFGHRPYVSEHPPVQRPHRPGQRAHRPFPPPRLRPQGRLAAHSGLPEAGAGHPPGSYGTAEHVRPRPLRPRARQTPSLRRPAATGNRPGRRVLPPAPAAGRARRRHEPRGNWAAHGAHPLAAAAVFPHHRRHRTSNAPRHGNMPAACGHPLRPRVGGRKTRRYPPGPEGAGSVLGRGGGGAVSLLEAENLTVAYGHIEAVKGITFTVEEGEMVAILGANGAGKTTTLRAISGLLPLAAGQVRFQGEVISGMPADRIVAMGMAHVPEGRRIFANLTVLENLLLATYHRKDRRQVQDDLERVFSLFPRLAERRDQYGGTLSGGEQQMLAVGRALMTRGRLILLDEPSMGLAPILVRDIFR